MLFCNPGRHLISSLHCPRLNGGLRMLLVPERQMKTLNNVRLNVSRLTDPFKKALLGAGFLRLVLGVTVREALIQHSPNTKKLCKSPRQTASKQMNPIPPTIKNSHNSNTFTLLRNNIKDYIIIHHYFSKSLRGKILVRNQVVAQGKLRQAHNRILDFLHQISGGRWFL